MEIEVLSNMFSDVQRVRRDLPSKHFSCLKQKVSIQENTAAVLALEEEVAEEDQEDGPYPAYFSTTQQ